jgi:hypothetical protein
MTLSSKAVLVQLNISQYTARKFDRKVSEEVAASHGTNISAGRYNKSLLPANDALAHVHQKTTLIRTEYYRNTLPWGIEGTQLLPSANYMDFMTEFRKHKAEWNGLVDTFINEYPALKVDARRSLGSMYKEEDYPEASTIHRKFRMDLAVSPVPEADFRVTLGDGEIETLKAEVEQRVGEAAHVAMQEVWSRLYDRVKHIADKLGDPKAIFRDSMLENAQEICDLLPKLNFQEDPNLDLLRKQVEEKLLGHHPDALRNDLDKRVAVAQEADLILKVMQGCMG